jgi:twitching motility protein PilT
MSETAIDKAVDREKFLKTGLKKYFEAALRYGASDLHLRGGLVPMLRVRGDLKHLDTDPLDSDQFSQWIKDTISEGQWAEYLRIGALDLAFELDDENRFRVNIFRTRNRSAIAARVITADIKDFAGLHLPPVLGNIAEIHQGLILLCGITGSGKSTTIASMLQHINQQRACHIITIEDPIEYIFKDDKALINQREIGIDVPDFSLALRAMVREDPDVVLIGELRDKVTFEAALQATETGHLVFGTIHASSSAGAFPRIYDLFPPEERPGVRTKLAFNMQAFMYQKLLPTLRDDIPRVPAIEVLLQSPAARKYIMDGKEHDLPEVIKAERTAGMQTLNDSLVDLVEREFIHPKVAQSATPNPQEVKMRLRGIKV